MTYINNHSIMYKLPTKNKHLSYLSIWVHLIGCQGVKLFFLFFFYWVSSEFEILSFVRIWVFMFAHNLIFFSFCKLLVVFSFVTIWFFLVFSQFDFFIWLFLDPTHSHLVTLEIQHICFFSSKCFYCSKYVYLYLQLKNPQIEWNLPNEIISDVWKCDFCVFLI